MAINTFEIREKPASPHFMGSKFGTPPTGRFARVSIDPNDGPLKRCRLKKKKGSPYLNGEKAQLLSRVTDKKFVNRNTFSSFPQAANLYRASSGELKALKKLKQTKQRPAKKSVLTLPNDPAPLPQSCTVSDMNDSEYFNLNRSTNNKKRTTTRNKTNKHTVRDKNIEYYDRDADHLRDCSSTCIIKNYDGDGKKVTSRTVKKSPDVTGQDVWAVLRNINQFQFRSSPLSESSGKMPKKRCFVKKHTKLRNGRRLIETTRTEEIAYVANFEIKDKSDSQSSSLDRITVINRNDSQKAELKNSVALRLDNKTNNPISLTDRHYNKLSPRSAVRTLQQNKRFEIVNKYRVKMPNTMKENNFGSMCTYTLADSLDSSNCTGMCDKYSTSDCQNKSLRHPNEIQEIISNINGVKNLKMLSSVERLTKGMTRMVFNEANNMFSNKYDVQKPKPRLVTTMPSAAAMPRLTTTDIKRRLAQIKFPVVVLGKDQLSSSIEIIDFDHPQFDGLDNHIWPFMVDWGKKSGVCKGRNGLQYKRMQPSEKIAQNLKKVNNELTVVKKIKASHDDNKRNRSEEETNRPLSAKKQKPIKQFKDKMLRLLYKKPSANCIQTEKETVLTKPVREPIVENKKVDISTETAVATYQELQCIKTGPKKLEDLFKTTKRANVLQPVLSSKFPGARNPWARGKWASDIIENVMKKITNGAYYRHEGKYSLNEDTNNEVCLVRDVVPDIKCIDTGTFVDFSDVSVQTFDVSILNDKSKSVGTLENLNDAQACEPYVPLPGFDDNLPELEIKTLNFNQIAVKHRLSNVMVQFDVAVPNKSSSNLITGTISTSSTCIPLSVTESHTKIFKCNTTILNAVLPAELCTVLPQVMRNIFDSNTSLNIKSITDSFATISEISEMETLTPTTSTCAPASNNTHLAAVSDQWIYPYWLYPPNQFMQLPKIHENQLTTNSNNDTVSIYATPWLADRLWVPISKQVPLAIPLALKNCMHGWFTPLGRQHKRKEVSKDVVLQRVSLKWSEYTNFHPVSIKAVMPIVVDPRELHMWPADKINAPLTEKSTYTMPPKQARHCVSNRMALQPYTEEYKRWIPTLGDFKSLLQETWNYCKFNIHFSMPCFLNSRQMTGNKKSITVDVVVDNDNGVERRVSVTVSNLKIDSLFSRFDNDNSKRQLVRTIQGVETTKISITKSACKIVEKTALAKKNSEKHNIHRKRYVKLYKKCKSTSNISSEKMYTSLSKIASLEDFFQALGSAKALSSVFDGCAAHNVMACLAEMKNWVKDITPRQALLILLLSNKEDTPNLVRFRPVILQGIAVNRITRATELDMEIQVIERENLCVSQSEGISYKSASDVNQNNLLEELSWIAKTTASDYQKPYNESSEKLLKSLLEKRKKLNPSYLRVMARYVGLGLLKTPVKCEKKCSL